jgi:hypothetical protein
MLGGRKFAGSTSVPSALNYQEAKRLLQNVQPASAAGMIGVSLFAPIYASAATVQSWLSTVPAGEYIMGHMPWSAPLQSLLSDLRYRHVVILRDPRTLLLALLFDDHVMPRFLSADFASMTPLQQVEQMWLGGHLPLANLSLQPFAAVYRSMLAWLRVPDCLIIRFEDLVGSTWGGRRAAQREALAQLASFLDVPIDEAVLARVDSIDDPSARTFAISQRATWCARVDREIIEYVDRRCEALCHEAAYPE